MADDRRQQLVDEVAEQIWAVLTAASGVTTDPNVLAHAAAQNLLPQLDRVAVDAAAEALQGWAKTLRLMARTDYGPRRVNPRTWAIDLAVRLDRDVDERRAAQLRAAPTVTDAQEK